jgi:hypothetical protein
MPPVSRDSTPVKLTDAQLYALRALRDGDWHFAARATSSGKVTSQTAHRLGEMGLAEWDWLANSFRITDAGREALNHE